MAAPASRRRTPGGGGVAADAAAAARRRAWARTVKQTATELTVERTMGENKVDQHLQARRHREQEHDDGPRRRSVEAVSTAKWDGRKLVIVTKIDMGNGVAGEHAEVVARGGNADDRNHQRARHAEDGLQEVAAASVSSQRPGLRRPFFFEFSCPRRASGPLSRCRTGNWKPGNYRLVISSRNSLAAAPTPSAPSPDRAGPARSRPAARARRSARETRMRHLEVRLVDHRSPNRIRSRSSVRAAPGTAARGRSRLARCRAARRAAPRRRARLADERPRSDRAADRRAAPTPARFR